MGVSDKEVLELLIKEIGIHKFNFVQKTHFLDGKLVELDSRFNQLDQISENIKNQLQKLEKNGCTVFGVGLD